MRRVIWLWNPTIFWLCDRTITLSYLVYMKLDILGRHKNVRTANNAWGESIRLFLAMFYVDTNFFWGIRQIFHTACLTKTSFLVSFWSMACPQTLTWRAAVFWLCKDSIIIRSLTVIWYEWFDETWAVLEVLICQIWLLR